MTLPAMAHAAEFRCPLSGVKRTSLGHAEMSAYDGEFNRSTQHLLIFPDEEVCGWRVMLGHGSRRSSGLSFGSVGRAVNVWRISRERLREGIRAASIGSWLSMEGSPHLRGGELRCR